MKNIHVIKTDKPSRLQLFEGIEGNEFELAPKGYYFNKGIQIYITSDEENPKAREWSLYQEKIHKCIEDIIGDEFKKIILTTDEELIKDGIQSIDDEFLEWFVNNPECEDIEVKTEPMFSSAWFNYKIIIPTTEEPKQERMYSEEEVERIAKNTAIEYIRQEFKNIGEDRLEDRYNHFRRENNIMKLHEKE